MTRAAAATALLALVAGWPRTEAAQMQSTPASRVVTLIRDIKARVEADGKKEQQSYDKYACWCEDVLQRKASKISEAKETIGDLETNMKELSGEIAAHGAAIDQLEKDIKDNIESQKEANSMREKENGEYTDEKTESEQCIGALEQAIKVLTGAGEGKAFLDTTREATLLSIVGRVRRVLTTPAAADKISARDLGLVRRFVDRPLDFAGGHAGGMSAVQTGNNPFGDYAPQSTQIQGILKGMYDAFTGDLEKANAEEAEQQKAHEELIATKQMELQTLQLTLEKHNLDKASATDGMSKSRRLRDDTREQLDADEEFFADTTSACRVKATEWSERMRLRTEELQGMATAIGILSSPEAQETFKESGATLVQLAGRRAGSAGRLEAYARLASLAARSGSAGLANLAAAVRNGGHFDKVIISIDKMIAILRKEEQEDIEHRDRCQNARRKSKQDMADIRKAIGKSKDEIKRMKGEAADLRQKIKDLEKEIADTQLAMKKALGMRNGEHADFQKALATDTEAISLLDQAVVALSRFYAKNKIPLGLAQQAPEYSQDEDKAPETSWSGANYGGRKQESHGVIEIIKMLKEDTEKEVAVARQEEAEAQEAYERGRAASQQIVDATDATKLETEQDLVELEGDTNDEEAALGQSKDDLSAEKKQMKSIASDCAWVKKHFADRRKKRKTEVDMLTEAKGFLAGAQ